MQTYDIYVGQNNNAVATPIQVDITNFPYAAKPSSLNFLTQSYNSATGILTVTVNFGPSSSPVIPLPDSSNACYPRTFCQPDGVTPGACKSALPRNDPRYQSSQNICAQWAVKDLDCPSSGCLGFAFTTSSSFAADDTVRRPTPQSFASSTSSGLPGWSTGYSNTSTVPDNSNNPKGQCWYASPLPGTPSCPSQD